MDDEQHDGQEADRRLISALSKWAGKSVSDVAKSAGLTPSTLTRVLNHDVKHRLSTPTLFKLRTRFAAFPGFSEAPDLPAAPSDVSYLPVSVLPSYAGMGGGGTGEGDELTALLPRALIEDQLRAKPADLLLLDVRGDSMEPDFQHGDQILVDRRDTDPRQPGPFALWDGDGYVVKLVERVPREQGIYRIFSANGRYSDYSVSAEEVRIMGRPVWFARRL
jgi:hypothetical protein